MTNVYIPDAAIISLSLDTSDGPLYLSTTSDPRDTADASARSQLTLTLRPHRQIWEQFRINQVVESGVYSLQHMGNDFLSPVDVDATMWRFRPHCQRWEHLMFTPTKLNFGIPTHFRISTRPGDQNLYLSRGPSHEVILSADIQSEWRVQLVDVPIVNLASYGGVASLLEVMDCPEYTNETFSSKELVRVLLRSMIDVRSLSMSWDMVSQTNYFPSSKQRTPNFRSAMMHMRQTTASSREMTFSPNKKAITGSWVRSFLGD